MNFMLGRNINSYANSTVCHNLLIRILSTGVSQTVLVEKNLEEPVIAITEDYNVDIIGPPDPVSNLRPIIRKQIANETPLQQKLRKMQDATQEWNQNFWSQHNKKFLKERQNYINIHSLETSEGRQQLSADEMSEFYKKFLDENWEEHFTYNFKWYRRNVVLLILALRVSLEKLHHKVLRLVENYDKTRKIENISF